MNHGLPIIRDGAGDLGNDCCPSGGTKELHRYPRTLPPRVVGDEEDDVLLDEAGLPILDEQTGTTIFDDLKT